MFDYREMVYHKEVCLLLFYIKIYPNDQPLDVQTKPFIYADDLRITCQDTQFDHAEETLSSAFNQLKEFYKINNLRANPSKTQLCVFHLKNRHANKKLNIIWDGQQIQHCDNPVYVGVTLHRSLTFKEHVTKTKAKVSTRNYILRKLTTSKWGASSHVLRSATAALPWHYLSHRLSMLALPGGFQSMQVTWTQS